MRVNKLNKNAPANTTQYVVKRGDTLYKIAARNKTTIQVLLDLNPELNANVLMPGMIINLPSQSNNQRPSEPVTPRPVVPPTDNMPNNNMPINNMPEDNMPERPIMQPDALYPDNNMPPAGGPNDVDEDRMNQPPYDRMMPPGDTRQLPPTDRNKMMFPDNNDRMMPPGDTRQIPPTERNKMMFPDDNNDRMMPPDNTRQIPPTDNNRMVPPNSNMPNMPDMNTMPMDMNMPENFTNPLMPPVINNANVNKPSVSKNNMMMPDIERYDCDETNKYIIQEGDTFYLISKRYDIALFDLLDANKTVNPYNLQVGQEICLPYRRANCKYGKYITVQNGETLADILMQYNISMSKLMSANPDVDLYNVREGMRMCIPAFQAYDRCPSDRTYVIERGDNISIISNKANVTMNELLMYNPKLRPMDFSIEGTRICLPAINTNRR